MKTIPCFRAGRHTDISGKVIEFSQSTLAAMCAAYDPSVHQAPLVVGHPTLDKPAYGWVDHFEVQGNQLVAIPTQVNTEFGEAVRGGSYKKISLSLYEPDNPHNPKPGVYYPKHVGFLGAQAPAIKGLSNVEFGEPEAGVVSFAADIEDGLFLRLFRNMRDWLIGQQGVEAADNVISQDDLDTLSYFINRPDQPDGTQSALFSEGSDPAAAVSQTPSAQTPATQQPQPTPNREETQVSTEQQGADPAALAAENARLKAELDAAKQSALQTKRATARAGHVAFAESLGKQLTPAEQGTVVDLLMLVSDGDQVVSFGEGDSKKPAIDGIKALLQKLPASKIFGERATKELAHAGTPPAGTGTSQFGESVDAERMDQHRQIVALAAQNNVSYAEAASSFMRGQR